MRLGIMQPYFCPYIGYFSLIKHTDKFILFDTAQFIRHGWIERNRVLKSDGGWQYISVPLVKHSQKTSINEIKINNDINWKEKIFAQLVHYKKAPYYNVVLEMMQEVFKKEYTDIVSLNKAVLEYVCRYLDISTEILIFSKMNLKLNEVKSADEWALNICQEIEGVDEYWNPPGGQDFFDTQKYERAGIDIKFQKICLRMYKQGKFEFVEGLSIIDVMMYNSPKEINDMLDDFELM